MKATDNMEQIIQKLKTLPPEQRAEAEDFVDFLASKTRKRPALERLLAIAPALEKAGIAPGNEEEVSAEIKAVRAERQARTATSPGKVSGADRS